MKRILVLVLLLFAMPARADTVQSWTWNPITKLFNGLTKQSGTKFVPDTETGTAVIGFQGPRTAAFTTTVRWARVGKIVTVSVSDNVSQLCNSANYFVSTTTLPSSIWPTASLVNPPNQLVLIQDNSASVANPGYASILTAGNIQIVRSLAAQGFTASGVCGWFAFSITYLI